MSWISPLFFANVTAQGGLLLGALYCLAVPGHRVYPMQRKGGLYYLMWSVFWFVFASNFALAAVDWNSGPWTSPHRFLLGVPLVVLGGGFVSWAIATLGVRNTSGLRDGFVSEGPYRFSRNPQYVGDIVLFVGVSLLANSERALVTQMLTSLLFVLAPLTEEPWLQAQYGHAYFEYRRDVPRFL